MGYPMEVLDWKWWGRAYNEGSPRDEASAFITLGPG